MKFATLSTGQVVAGTKDGYRIVNNRKSMIDVIENPSGLTFSGDPMELPETLAPPVPRPSKIWAAAGNFYRGVNAKDPDGKSSRGEATTLSKEELLHSIFLKPPSAIIGPGDSIVIPPGAGGVFPEVELCIVIGKRCRNSPSSRRRRRFLATPSCSMSPRATTARSNRASRCAASARATIPSRRLGRASPRVMKSRIWAGRK